LQSPFVSLFSTGARAAAAAALVCALAAPAAAAGAAPVGYARISVPGNTAQRGNSSGRLDAIVWYPATAGTATSPIEVGPPGQSYFTEGEAAPDAPLAATPATFPFVVVSHGTGGTAMDLSWLCEALAAHGYLVASVNHPGNNALEAPTVAGATLWWQRADDLSHVIDGVLASPNFGPRVDRSRIGAAGFSLGGLTVLMIAGARADASRLDAYCAHDPSTQVCTGEATPTVPNITARANALAASDPAYRAAALANRDSHRDPRVKAVFSIAPALGPAILPESLASIDIPIELVAGFGDPVLPVADNVIPDALAIANAQLTLWPKPVGHYTFLTDCTPLGAQKFASICADAGPGRVAVHRATAELAVAFFARTIGR
jgi:predicted dienelactone hydrolase